MAGGTSAPLLIRFYDPQVKAADSNGRTLDDILNWNDSKLESCHDYIQTIFPLPEGSMFNYGANIVTQEVMEAFRARADLRVRLRASFLRMLRFYGFEMQEESDEPSSLSEMPKQSGQPIKDGEETSKSGEEAVEESEEAPKKSDGSSEAITEATKETDEISANPEPAQDITTTTDKSEHNGEGETNGNIADSGSAKQTITTASIDVKSSAPDQNETIVATPSDSQGEKTTAPETSEKKTMEDQKQNNLDSTSATKVIKTQAKVKSLIPASRIVRGPNWAQNSRNWAVPIDHNHLRITRILRSLRVLGLQEECEAFFEALLGVVNDPNNRLGKRSLGYWRRAVELPLHIAPDGTEVSWLEKWVRQHEGMK
jgi:hypothetical protein